MKPSFPETLYEIKPPDFEYAAHDPRADVPASDLPPLRYVLEGDIFRPRDTQPETGEAVLAIAGDLLCQERQIEHAKYADGDGYRASFVRIRPLLHDADLVLGNLEAPVCPEAPLRGERLTTEGHFYCNAPTAYLDALAWAGFDILSTANNHALDAGETGIRSTLRSLDSRGFLHTGTFQRPDDPSFVLVEVRGIRVAVLAYATGFNGLEDNLTRKGLETLLNPYRRSKAARDIRAARKRGAEFVLAMVHFGREYAPEPTLPQKQIARELAALGCDYIVGSHPHVVQRYQILSLPGGRRVPVVYSMGNFVSHQYRKGTKESLLLKLRLSRSGGAILCRDSYQPLYCFGTLQGARYVTRPCLPPLGFPHPENGRYNKAAERVLSALGPDLPPEPLGFLDSILPPAASGLGTPRQQVPADDSDSGSEILLQPSHIDKRPLSSFPPEQHRSSPRLRAVYLGKNLKTVPKDGFRDCAALEGVRTREGLRRIEESAFEGCLSLTGFVAPRSLRAVGARAFAGCTGLRSIKSMGSSLSSPRMLLKVARN